MPQKPDKLRVAMISGGVIGVVSAIPGLNLINCCCCAGIILGGFLAVYLYKQEFTLDMSPLQSSDALILGVSTGVVSAFTTTILNVLILALFGDIGVEFIKSIMDQLIEQANLPQETVEELRRQIEASMAEATTFIGVMKELLFNLLIHPIFAMAGAMIGFSIFRPKQTPDQSVQPGA